MSCQNFIEFEPDALKVIKDEKIYKMLSDPVYEPIIIVLREGPLTVNELTKRYNAFVDKRGTDLGLSPEVLKKEKKSEMTIYRYLKDLKRVNLVIEAGRCIEPGKKSTKAIYSRTARMFYPKLSSSNVKDSEKIDEHIDILSELIIMYKTDQKLSKSCLSALLKKLVLFGDTEATIMFEKYGDEISALTKDQSFSQMGKILTNLGSIILMLNAHLFDEELKLCFKEE